MFTNDYQVAYLLNDITIKKPKSNKLTFLYFIAGVILFAAFYKYKLSIGFDKKN